MLLSISRHKKMLPLNFCRLFWKGSFEDVKRHSLLYGTKNYLTQLQGTKAFDAVLSTMKSGFWK